MSEAVKPTGLPGLAAAEGNQQERDLVVVAQGGGVAFVGTTVTRATNYLYNMVLVWALGGENFGLFTLAMAVITFAGVMAELGLGLGVVRFGSIGAAEHGPSYIHKVTMAALAIALPTGILLFLICQASASFIAQDIFDKPLLVPFFRILSWGVPLLAAQSILVSSTKALKIMKYATYVGICQSTSAFGLAIACLVWKSRPEILAGSYVLSQALGTCLALYFYLHAIPREPLAVPFPIGQMVRFSAPLSLTKWIQFANERIEVIFLGFLPSAIYVGIYRIAWSLAGLESMLRLSLEEILAPFSSDLSHRKETGQLEALYKTTAKWSFTAALVLAMLYAILGTTIMRIFDPSYTAGVGVLMALALAMLFNEATGACGTILVMCGRSDLSLLNTALMLIASIAFGWTLIPRYGLTGAAFTGAFTIVMVNLLRVIEVWALLKIHPFSWKFIKPALAGLAAGLLVWMLRAVITPGLIWTDLLYALVFIAAYIVAIYLLKWDFEDLVILNSMKRRIAGRLANFKGAT